MAGFALASGGLPDPALAALAATGLRVEADAAARARTRRDETGLEEARRRAGAIAEQVERIAAALGSRRCPRPVGRAIPAGRACDPLPG